MKLKSKKRIMVSIRKRRKRNRLKKPLLRRFVARPKRSLIRGSRISVHPVGAIIIASNAEGTILHVLEQLKRLPLNEIIVFDHGSQDRTVAKVRGHSHAIIVHHPELIEHDVARALAAKISQSDFLLFIEGDRAVKIEELIPCIQDVQKGIENGTLTRRHELAAYEHNYSYV